MIISHHTADMATSDVQPSFQESLINFSHNVYSQIENAQSECLSPYSITSALLMLMLGTRGNTKTQLQSSILGRELPDNVVYPQYKALNDRVFNSTENIVTVATKLYVKKGMKLSNSVRRKAKTFFEADIEQTDFNLREKTVKEINSYISKRTNNKINDFVPRDGLDPSTVMFLVNAVYFKATWEKEFDPKNTRKRDFFLTENSKVKVDMMTMRHNVRFFDGLDYSAISLPYTGKQFEMIFVLPKKINGLTNLQKSFTSKMSKDIESKLDNTLVQVNLPKFKFVSRTDLEPVSRNVGITDIFSEVKADLSRLFSGNSKKLVVSKASHQVFIEIDEKGTEAAGVTGIEIGVTSAPPTFTANHPFLFYIKHSSSDTILFMGHYNPSQKAA